MSAWRLLRVLALALSGLLPFARGHWGDEEAEHIENLEHPGATPGMCGSWKGLHTGDHEQGLREAHLLAMVKQEGVQGAEAAQFMAQASYESGAFKKVEEDGDVGSYKGRGYFRIQGRSEYEKYGEAIGINLVNNPFLASSFEVAAKVAVAFWKSEVRPKISDFRGAEGVTQLVACRRSGGSGCNRMALQPKLSFERYLLVCSSDSSVCKA